MIKPVGSDKLLPLYIYDDSERDRQNQVAADLPSVIVSSAAAANAVMLGGGYFTPLQGYMNLQDAIGVAREMRTGNGAFSPGPERMHRCRYASRALHQWHPAGSYSLAGA